MLRSMSASCSRTLWIVALSAMKFPGSVLQPHEGVDSGGCLEQARQQACAHLLRGHALVVRTHVDRRDDAAGAIDDGGGQRDQPFLELTVHERVALASNLVEDREQLRRIGDGAAGA